MTTLQQWSKEKIWEWYNKQPWLCGFNYIPATSINYTEMWQRESYDPRTIDEELTFAEAVGFNCVRVVLQYLVWEDDAQGLLTRMDDFLALAHKHKMRVMFCLFDDCDFGTTKDPYLGKQADVVPGFYANDWSPSPGHTMVRDSGMWPKLEAYVKAVVGHFADDERVLIWDVYNEPNLAIQTNNGLNLVEHVFGWVRGQRPIQPLTLGIWQIPPVPETEALITAHSDLISFHVYSNADETAAMIDRLLAFGLPLVCTEWLNRPRGSRVDTILPIFFEKNVGCFFWGLVNGKTQTHYPWGSKAGAPEPTVWQHDIFRADRQPYDQDELELFGRYLQLSRNA